MTNAGRLIAEARSGTAETIAIPWPDLPPWATQRLVDANAVTYVSDTVTTQTKHGAVTFRLTRVDDVTIDNSGITFDVGPAVAWINGEDMPLDDASQIMHAIESGDDIPVRSIQKDRALSGLRSYRMSRESMADLVRQAFAAGASKAEIVTASGLSRKWVDRIVSLEVEK